MSDSRAVPNDDQQKSVQYYVEHFSGQLSQEIAADLEDGEPDKYTRNIFRKLLFTGHPIDTACAEHLTRLATDELVKEHKLPDLRIVASDRRFTLSVVKPGLEATTWSLGSSGTVEHTDPLEGKLAELVPVLCDLIDGKPLDTESALTLSKHWKSAPDNSSKDSLVKALQERLNPFGASMRIDKPLNVIRGVDYSGRSYAYDLDTGKPRDLAAESTAKSAAERAAAASPSWYERIQSLWKLDPAHMLRSYPR